MPDVTAVALQAPSSVDEVTLTKSGAGVISAKTGNGANQVPILTAAGKYPALDGSLITGLTQDVGEGHITLLSVNYSAIVGTWAYSAVAGAWANAIFYNSSAAQNDEIDFKVYLQAGTYTLVYLYLTGANYGICTFKLDATTLGTQDQYAASQTINNRATITGIVVATTGFYTLKLIGATKNGSSSAYIIGHSSVGLFRTA